ncbi:MAG TPA: hypothetical protein VEL68_08745 [Thermodesulfobacteriota bacterium]|nr:hypothetical protein [Thermodesulfobacteriota bacterium]
MKPAELSAEEILAGKAVQKIRTWLEKETENRGGDFTTRLAIKFCGGCNPLLEREELAAKVRRGLSASQWVSWEEDSDLVLIINGCPTACADRAQTQKNSRACLVIQPGGVSDIEKMHRA